MNKLTEIREYTAMCKKTGFRYHGAVENIEYLLSLLEEKDKALQEIIEAYDEGEQYFPTVRKMTRIARKALNSSSNNEGETQP